MLVFAAQEYQIGQNNQKAQACTAHVADTDHLAIKRFLKAAEVVSVKVTRYEKEGLSAKSPEILKAKRDYAAALRLFDEELGPVKGCA